MNRRNTSGQHRKVEQARRVVQRALGDAARHDSPENTTKIVPMAKVEPEPEPSQVEYVLTLGEVAAKLGITRGEVERMIAAGKLRALPTGYMVTVPVGEVQRLERNYGRS